MNLNSAALKMMIAKGLTLEDVAEIVAANEVTRDPTAAERQARYRARKQSETSRRNVTRNTPLNEDILNPPNTPTPSGVGPGPVEKKSRGTRLPDNWQLPAEGAAFAKSKRRWADTEIAEEATLFANYWQSRSGAGAVHRDWNKTWQNWVIKSHRPDGKGGVTVELTAQQLRERAEWFVRHGQPDRADECRKKAIEKERMQAA
jgi:hypothetical protein